MLTQIEGKLYALIKSSLVLSANGSKGRKHWQAHVIRGDDGRYHTTTSSWHIPTKTGTMSKVMWAVPHFAIPVNVGKSNATTNETQALAEFESMVAKETRLREQVRVQAQLAHKVGEQKHKLTYPLMIQPKYDGMRLLTDGAAVWSRGNKDAVVAPVAHIFPLPVNAMTLDGELTFRDIRKVNEVMSAAKKFRAGVSDTLIYTVYDIAELGMTFRSRWNALKAWYAAASAEVRAKVRLSDVYIVASEVEGMALHAQLTEQGYEGTIWRNLDGLYTSGKRSYDMLKLKDFVDQEYKILDIIPQGGGTGERRAKFICIDEKGDDFESNATGTEEEQMEYLTNKDTYIGQWAKVKFRELSGAKQVPFHSNVLEIREQGDF